MVSDNCNEQVSWMTRLIPAAHAISKAHLTMLGSKRAFLEVCSCSAVQADFCRQSAAFTSQLSPYAPSVSSVRHHNAKSACCDRSMVSEQLRITDATWLVCTATTAIAEKERSEQVHIRFRLSCSCSCSNSLSGRHIKVTHCCKSQTLAQLASWLLMCSSSSCKLPASHSQGSYSQDRDTQTGMSCCMLLQLSNAKAIVKGAMHSQLLLLFKATRSWSCRDTTM